MQPRTSLKIAFFRADISQRRASIAVSIPETRLSAIVRGRTDPLPRERAALSSLLGQSEDVLFPDDEACPA